MKSRMKCSLCKIELQLSGGQQDNAGYCPACSSIGQDHGDKDPLLEYISAMEQALVERSQGRLQNIRPRAAHHDRNMRYERRKGLYRKLFNV
ncbi:MAG: hypothetical protein GC139_01460 [Sideroxydans sp.]|nr:hypothetical protein [Sideroxydans sp.]